VGAATEASLTVTFAGSGDAFGSGGRFQACLHLRPTGDEPGEPGGSPVLLDCGATSLTALRTLGLDPGEVAAVFVSHLHADHFGGLPFLILDGQFSRRTRPLTVAGPAGTARRLRQAMEAGFPGSADVRRRFPVHVTELTAGATTEVAGCAVTAFPVDHPSGAPALALRLRVGGKVIAYTGDTAWTPLLTELAARADLLIAEAYYFSKPVPYHLRHADLLAHRDELTSRRIILTHPSADLLAHRDDLAFDLAHDGLVIDL
jgi:ribonuclease BN (tRNA processing enzyme)